MKAHDEQSVHVTGVTRDCRVQTPCTLPAKLLKTMVDVHPGIDGKKCLTVIL